MIVTVGGASPRQARGHIGDVRTCFVFSHIAPIIFNSDAALYNLAVHKTLRSSLVY